MQQGSRAFDEEGRVVGRDKESLAAVADDFGYTIQLRGHHRKSHGHGFEERHWQALVTRWHEKDIRCEIDQAGVGHIAREGDTIRDAESDCLFA